MRSIYLHFGVIVWFVVHVFTTNVDHDLFLKHIHLQELGIQINHMHEKLYETCPTHFQIPNIGSIIGRRQSVNSSLDLKIELAEMTLDYLIQKYGNCTRVTTGLTSRTSTTAYTQTSSTTTIKSTPTHLQTALTSDFRMTTHRSKYAFQVLRSQNVSQGGYDFLVLEVRVPLDGISRSPNWCYDYQYLCQDFQRRPTGCGTRWMSYSPYAICRDKYDSDVDIGNVLGCNPSDVIADLANRAFPNLSAPAEYHNAFGFHRCNYCNETIYGSRSALAWMAQFWLNNVTMFYTVCR